MGSTPTEGTYGKLSAMNLSDLPQHVEGAWLKINEPCDACHPSGWSVRPPRRRSFVPLHPDHIIAEHADGTITVTPSIQYGNPGDPDYWHGFLVAGIFTEA